MIKEFKHFFNMSYKSTGKISNDNKENDIIYTREELLTVQERLYKCRDLEISNLWQKSVFLSAFMIICFTGYGYLLMKMIDNIDSGSLYNATKIASGKNMYFNITAIALGSISTIFSILWICMAKSSKSWYEVYETAITKLENDYGDILKIPNNYIMGEMNVDISKIDKNLFTTKAGAFSPSKINIAVGQICAVIWIITTILHLFLYLNSSFTVLMVSFIIILVVIYHIFLFLVWSSWIKSSFLNSKD